MFLTMVRLSFLLFRKASKMGLLLGDCAGLFLRLLSGGILLELQESTSWVCSLKRLLAMTLGAPVGQKAFLNMQ